MNAELLDPVAVVYPESDGAPLAENTDQLDCIVTLYGGFDALFRDRPDVAVFADLFWYPVQGRPAVVQAPDVMVVFGRPKGRRGSYQQWREGGIAPQVAVEVRSPSNAAEHLDEKRQFYDRHGVVEYYLYGPADDSLAAWRRVGPGLRPVPIAGPLASPLLGVTFEAVGGLMPRVVGPDGEPFRPFRDERAATLAARAEARRQRQAAETAQSRADALAAKLRALGHDPDA